MDRLQLPGTVYGADGWRPGSAARLPALSSALVSCSCHNADVFIKWICAAAATPVDLSLVQGFCFLPVARLLDPRRLFKLNTHAPSEEMRSSCSL